MTVYYPTRCDNCGWRGSSEDVDGGGPLADTGDSADLLCPHCHLPIHDEMSSGDCANALHDAHARIAEQDEELARLRAAIQGALNNLSVPDPDYPAPFHEAREILFAAIEGFKHDG